MSNPDPNIRVEYDALGPVSLPADALYGPQTARAIENFDVSSVALHDFPGFVRALAYVKKAAAEANFRLGLLTAPLNQSICAACDEVLGGLHHQAFAVGMFQGGAGTSTNMNANEVIANVALQRQGQSLGSYEVIHPNDHVNLSQSTNDVYPTAIRIALLFGNRGLQQAIARLADGFEARATEFSAIRKLGRTQLQDAVPMTLGQEFQAFASTLREDVERLQELSHLLCEINLGGTAIGTAINAPARYQTLVVPILADFTGLPLTASANLIEASWDTGAFVLYSGMLKRVATKLSKIANDLRLLSSGPRGGIGEINLPPLQPGSSIMPGKINPVLPELVSQVAFQVIGADITITMASEAGQLQLNAMEPVILFNILNSIDLLHRVCDALATRCVAGITANPDICLAHLDKSTALVTELVPLVGYERASRIAYRILGGDGPAGEILAFERALALSHPASEPAQ